MVVIFSLLLLAGAVIHALLDGFTVLNILYIVLPALLLGYSLLTRSQSSAPENGRKPGLPGKWIAMLVFLALLFAASRLFPASGRFSEAAAVNHSAGLLQAGRYELAARELQKQLERNPNDPYANMNLAVVYLKEHKPELVRKHLDIAAQRLSSNENLWFNYGLMHYQIEDYKNAQLCFEQAIAINPDMAKAHIYAGTMSYRLRELQRALYHLENARFLQPDSPDILLHIGRSHMELMHYEQAEQAFKEALALHPAPELEKSLKELAEEAVDWKEGGRTE